MDLLNKQLVEYKAQDKKQEQLQKRLGMQENKMKSLNEDIGKMKKGREELQRKIKEDQDRFAKYKQAASKELADAKKTQSQN